MPLALTDCSLHVPVLLTVGQLQPVRACGVDWWEACQRSLTPSGLAICILGYIEVIMGYIRVIMENQMEKQMDNDMETGIIG